MKIESDFDYVGNIKLLVNLKNKLFNEKPNQIF